MVLTSTVRLQRWWAALHFAIDRQLPKVVELLIKHGADINSQENNGWTPMDRAIDSKLPHLVELLIKHGADINLQAML